MFNSSTTLPFIQQAGGFVVTFDADVHALALVDAIAECVQISVAGKAQHAADGVGKVEDGVGRAEQYGVRGLGGSVDVEGDAVVVADFAVRSAAAWSYGGLFVHQSRPAFDAAQLVHARRFAEPVAQPVEVGVGKRGFAAVHVLTARVCMAGKTRWWISLVEIPFPT